MKTKIFLAVFAIALALALGLNLRTILADLGQAQAQVATLESVVDTQKSTIAALVGEAANREQLLADLAQAHTQNQEAREEAR